MSRVDLDCRGVPCPRPIIELAKAVAGIGVGDTVAVTADDPAARVDVEAWCRMRQQEYVGEQTDPDGVPTYVVRRVS
ncbi:sulfurtransferase TusA family protein [Marmoricola sp. URHB0036]|uniref:sulfurtransferase TusA family protein n=1 Tax=Marmoricola sp. URHB0036 TaxID=1298863 RepID=UPI00040B5D4A|nr:sulfurtransferase TusA family protein [Marmoricola sp. URHB0036]